MLRDSEVDRLPDCESRWDSEEEIERDTESLSELISEVDADKLLDTERESELLIEIELDILSESDSLMEV